MIFRRLFRHTIPVIVTLFIVLHAPGLTMRTSANSGGAGDCPICAPGLAIHNTLTFDASYSSQPTCTAAGQTGLWCYRCGYQTSTTIPALGHAPSESVTAAPTCTADGTRTSVCTRCGQSLGTSSIPALGHNYDAGVVTTAPTCTAEGVTTFTCMTCGDAQTQQLPALGHDLHTEITVQPTCTAAGTETTSCTRCTEATVTQLPALGHALTVTVVKEATCTQAGRERSTCSRCNDTREKDIPATGHDYEETRTEPTCEEDGEVHAVCTVCGDVKDEVLAATGHDCPEMETVNEATCEEDGLRKGVCSNCRETVEEIIEKKGHDYPESWTIERESSIFRAGLESRTCAACGARIEQPIPRKSAAPAAAVIIILLGAGAAGTTAAAKNWFHKPSLETKKLVVCSGDEDLLNLFHSKRFINDTSCDEGSLADTVRDVKPDLVICNIDSKKRLDEVVALEQADPESHIFGLVIDPAVIEQHKDELDRLVEDKEISGYISTQFSPEAVLTRLVAPFLKPDPKSDGTLSSIGIVADLLGIPGVCSVIEAFTAGRELKEIVQEGHLDTMDHVTIISDIAEILGLDTAADVLELITDVNQLRVNQKTDARVAETTQM